MCTFNGSLMKSNSNTQPRSVKSHCENNTAFVQSRSDSVATGSKTADFHLKNTGYCLFSPWWQLIFFTVRLLFVMWPHDDLRLWQDVMLT